MRDKDKIIVKLIEMIYDSLNSHLDLIVNEAPKTARDYIGGKRFNKKCVKEYSQIIKMLSDLL